VINNLNWLVPGPPWLNLLLEPSNFVNVREALESWPLKERLKRVLLFAQQFFSKKVAGKNS